MPEFACGGVVIRLDAGLSEPVLLYRLVRLVQVPHEIIVHTDHAGADDIADVFVASIVMRVAVGVAMSSSATPTRASTRGRKHRSVGRRELRVSGAVFEGILGFLGGGRAVQVQAPPAPRPRRRASSARTPLTHRTSSVGHNELLV